MKDYTQAELETGYGRLDAKQTIDFCLSCLYADTTHKISDVIVDSRYAALTFEELIGALLIARDTIIAADGW
jgi:hypothetical protein